MEKTNQALINKVRNRQQVLNDIVPRMLSLTSKQGQKLRGFSGRSVEVRSDVLISAHADVAHRAMLSVYAVIGDRVLKVFSAHVIGSASNGDPDFFRYCEGTVAVLSWRRGEWEDAIIAAEPAPGSNLERLIADVRREQTTAHNEPDAVPAIAAYD